VVSEAGERLIAFAYEQPTGEERDRVIAQTKKILSGYLFPAVGYHPRMPRGLC
jgi:hypothetical protein